MEVNLHPKTCNLCGGDVIFTSNAVIYQREYGSGMAYLCTKCGAYVGTNKTKPDDALGILANKEMRNMKMKCHDIFDRRWKNARNRKKARFRAYQWLSRKLNIPISECHFGYFDMDTLKKAYDILLRERY